MNPFKQMPYFTEKEIDMYQGAVSVNRYTNSSLIKVFPGRVGHIVLLKVRL